MYDLFINYLSDKLEKDIQKNIKENNHVEYDTKLISIEDVFGDKHCVFTIIKSKTKGKLKDNLKIEEKLKISSCGKDFIGTLVNIVDDKLHVLLSKEILEGRYTITKLINFNNNIIKQELIKIQPRGVIDEFVHTNFLVTLLNNLELISKIVGVQNMKEDLILCYMTLLKCIYDVERDTLIDLFMKSCE